MTAHDGNVHVLGLAPVELRLERLLLARVLREHHDARRIAINAVQV